MGIINGTGHKEKRIYLRKNQTPEEAFVWKMLRGRKTKLKWRRQVSIGRYVADFYCSSKKIVLELDGRQHEEFNNKEYDEIRTKFFNDLNIQVIRVTNSELENDPMIIFNKIESCGT